MAVMFFGILVYLESLIGRVHNDFGRWTALRSAGPA